MEVNMKWEYIDEVSALVIIIGCIVLRSLGIDGEINNILWMAAGWAFGGGYARVAKKGGK
jgi:hypothetical protein